MKDLKFNSEAEPFLSETYEVCLTFMHGDADLDTKEFLYFDTVQEVTKFYYAFLEFLKVGWDHYNRCFPEFNRREFFENLEIEEDSKLGKMFDSPSEYFWPDDETCEVYLATPTEIEIFYYDEAGRKYKTSNVKSYF